MQEAKCNHSEVIKVFCNLPLFSEEVKKLRCLLLAVYCFLNNIRYAKLQMYFCVVLLFLGFFICFFFLEWKGVIAAKGSRIKAK